MGHYDDYYEFYESEEYIKLDNETHKKLANINDEMSAEDRELLIELAGNLNEIRAIVHLIKKIK